MKTKHYVLALAGVFAATTAYGSGYRIPEQSINSTALANAYIASTRDADTAYFNPANMSFIDDGWHTDVELMYIHLPKVDYKGSFASAPANGDSKEEDFIIPLVHAVSPEINNFRFGFSVAVPYGLSKQWDEPFQMITAETFALQTVELNPTVSYKLLDNFAVAGGLRVVQASGEVKSDGIVSTLGGILHSAKRDLEGDTIEYGYNLAVTFMPENNWSIAATYRSEITLGVEGDAELYYGSNFGPYSLVYDGSASIEIPIPAVLTLATSYTFNNTTVELAYDKTYWSAYKELDFEYSSALTHPVLGPAFDDTKDKSWSDTNAYRLGITHKCTEKFTVMAGIAIDGNPVPDNTLGFELPDSNAVLYSFGFKYIIKERLKIGAAYLFDDKEGREVDQGATGIQGTFGDGGAHLVNIGANYSF